MGYTHYWEQIQTDPEDFALAVAKANKVLEAERAILADGHGEGPLVLADDEVDFNGRGSDCYETCLVRNESSGFEFCKTERKPYDRVVVAVLAIFRHVLASRFRVSSDGARADWEEGVALACRATGEAIPNPIHD